MTMPSQLTEHTHDLHHRARESTAVDVLVRLGITSYGVVHLLIAWLALQLAFGDRSGSVDKSGALRQLAQQPLGRGLLWVVAVGFAALVLWQVLELLVGPSEEDSHPALHTASAAIKVGVFAVLAWTSYRIASHSGGGGGDSTETWTSRLMALPMGQWLVGALGLAVIGVGIAGVVKGVTDRYEKHLDLEGRSGTSGTVLKVTARVGYTARGVALAAVGGLFVWAAVTHDAKKSGGLDEALNRLLDAPAGPVLMVLIGLGFACYGVFCFGWARHFRR